MKLNSDDFLLEVSIVTLLILIDELSKTLTNSKGLSGFINTPSKPVTADLVFDMM